jgi:ADP-heptose:LPS heptosyltransferase
LKRKKILIIKFGGLGDVILSLSAMYSIFKNSKKKISLLTEVPFNKFLKQTCWFEEIITIKRSLFYFYDIYQIKNKINIHTYNEVFDLQTSKRSSHYLKIFKKSECKINGIGKYSNLTHTNPNRNTLHTIQRQKDQLKLSKIKFFKNPDISWLFRKKIKFEKKKIVLIVPGGSGSRLNKRIPIEIFYEITSLLLKFKIFPILIGASDDLNVCKKINEKFPESINMCMKTDFFDIASLAQKAIFSIGNDTGPMHIISLAKKKTIILFTQNSDPDLCSPVGNHIEILKYQNGKINFKKKVLKKTIWAINQSSILT